MRLLHPMSCTAVWALLVSACVQPAGRPPELSGAPVCNILDYGAVADDRRADTAALQSAIDSCAGRRGRVIVPPGSFETGMLTLGSDMTLHLDSGALIQLVADIDLYPEIVVPRPDGDADRFRTAFYAPGATNLLITGSGVIDGNGPEFWDTDYYSSGLRRPTRPRPQPVFELSDCRHVSLTGITIRNLPAAAIRFHRCTDTRAADLTIQNDPRSPNTDGIQVRDSSDIVIERVRISTGDDAIVLKSDERAVENIKVRASVLESDDSGIRFGTGSAIGVRNSVFSDIEIRNSRYGIAIFQIDGGRHANNLFENISIRTGSRHVRDFAIFIDIDRRTADRELGEIDSLTFRNISIETDASILIAGNPLAPLGSLTFESIRIGLTDPLVEVGTTGSKPRGNVNIEPQPGSADYSNEPATVVIAHAGKLEISGMSFTDSGVSRPADLLLIAPSEVSLRDVEARSVGSFRATRIETRQKAD